MKRREKTAKIKGKWDKDNTDPREYMSDDFDYNEWEGNYPPEWDKKMPTFKEFTADINNMTPKEKEEFEKEYLLKKEDEELNNERYMGKT